MKQKLRSFLLLKKKALDKNYVLNFSLTGVLATFSKIFDKVIKNHLMKKCG